MRVSLQIDGDAKGAVDAAQETGRAIGDLGKQTDQITKAIEEGFNRASGAIGKTGENKDVIAANDNAASSALGLANMLGQVAGKATDADSALGKAASGATSLAKGIGELMKGAGVVASIGTALGLALTVATTFYGIVNSGADKANKQLDEQARLVGVIKDAYRDASKTAGEFYTQSKSITLLQAQQNLIQLQAAQASAAKDIANRLSPNPLGVINGSIPGEAGMDNGLAGALFPDQSNQRFIEFQGAFDRLTASIAAGTNDIAGFRNEVAAIGNAAAGTNPKIAELANGILTQTKSAGDLATGVAKAQATMAVLNGTATEQQRALLGLSNTTNQAGSEFDRLTKAMERRAASEEAEAKTVGKSAGEAAKLRTQYLLNEAAAQSGIKVNGEYADTIDRIANRFGAAAQAAALANVRSQAAFDLSQLGRNTVDGTVAGQLRQVYGDNVEAQMNGALATSLRFNESMKDLKATTVDLGQGAFRDFRMQIEQGAGAFKALETAGVNAFNKIIDKIADRSIDNFVSSLFGAAGNAGGGIIGSIGKLFAAAGGGTFGPGWGIVGEEGPELIKVHAGGGVTVIPNQASKPFLPGFAAGGSLSPWGDVTRFQPAQGGGAQQSIQQVQVQVGVSVDEDGQLQAYVKSVSQDTAAAGLKQYRTSQQMARDVAAHSTKAAVRGWS